MTSVGKTKDKRREETDDKETLKDTTEKVLDKGKEKDKDLESGNPKDAESLESIANLYRTFNEIKFPTNNYFDNGSGAKLGQYVRDLWQSKPQGFLGNNIVKIAEFALEFLDGIPSSANHQIIFICSLIDIYSDTGETIKTKALIQVLQHLFKRFKSVSDNSSSSKVAQTLNHLQQKHPEITLPLFKFLQQHSLSNYFVQMLQEINIQVHPVGEDLKSLLESVVRQLFRSSADRQFNSKLLHFIINISLHFSPEMGDECGSIIKQILVQAEETIDKTIKLQRVAAIMSFVASAPSLNGLYKEKFPLLCKHLSSGDDSAILCLTVIDQFMRVQSEIPGSVDSQMATTFFDTLLEGTVHFTEPDNILIKRIFDVFVPKVRVQTLDFFYSVLLPKGKTDGSKVDFGLLGSFIVNYIEQSDITLEELIHEKLEDLPTLMKTVSKHLPIVTNSTDLTRSLISFLIKCFTSTIIPHQTPEQVNRKNLLSQYLEGTVSDTEVILSAFPFKRVERNTFLLLGHDDTQVRQTSLRLLYECGQIFERTNDDWREYEVNQHSLYRQATSDIAFFLKKNFPVRMSVDEILLYSDLTRQSLCYVCSRMSTTAHPLYRKLLTTSIQISNMTTYYLDFVVALISTTAEDLENLVKDTLKKITNTKHYHALRYTQPPIYPKFLALADPTQPSADLSAYLNNLTYSLTHTIGGSQHADRESLVQKEIDILLKHFSLYPGIANDISSFAPALESVARHLFDSDDLCENSSRFITQCLQFLMIVLLRSDNDAPIDVISTFLMYYLDLSRLSPDFDVLDCVLPYLKVGSPEKVLEFLITIGKRFPDKASSVMVRCSYTVPSLVLDALKKVSVNGISFEELSFMYFLVGLSGNTKKENAKAFEEHCSKNDTRFLDEVNELRQELNIGDTTYEHLFITIFMNSFSGFLRYATGFVSSQRDVKSPLVEPIVALLVQYLDGDQYVDYSSEDKKTATQLSISLIRNYGEYIKDIYKLMEPYLRDTNICKQMYDALIESSTPFNIIIRIIDQYDRKEELVSNNLSILFSGLGEGLENKNGVQIQSLYNRYLLLCQGLYSPEVLIVSQILVQSASKKLSEASRDYLASLLRGNTTEDEKLDGDDPLNLIRLYSTLDEGITIQSWKILHNLFRNSGEYRTIKSCILVIYLYKDVEEFLDKGAQEMLVKFIKKNKRGHITFVASLIQAFSFLVRHGYRVESNLERMEQFINGSVKIGSTTVYDSVAGYIRSAVKSGIRTKNLQQLSWDTIYFGAELFHLIVEEIPEIYHISFNQKWGSICNLFWHELISGTPANEMPDITNTIIETFETVSVFGGDSIILNLSTYLDTRTFKKEEITLLQRFESFLKSSKEVQKGLMKSIEESLQKITGNSGSDDVVGSRSSLSYLVFRRDPGSVLNYLSRKDNESSIIPFPKLITIDQEKEKSHEKEVNEDKEINNRDENKGKDGDSSEESEDS